MKDIIILYHGDCPDGFGAAWAAHKKFGDKAEYIPVSHNHPFPKGLKDKTVYLVDFCYPEEMMKELMAVNKTVTAIDHHVTREAVIKMTKDFSYAVNNSGSVLSWKYFNKGVKVPKMLEYIEDRDLWSLKLKEAEFICAYLDTFEFKFSVWDKLAADIEKLSTRKKYLEKGKIIKNHEVRLMERIIKDDAKLVIFEGHEVYAVNAPHFFASYIGSMLYKKKPPFAIVWREANDAVHVSLRSDKTFDVSKLAKKYGGGGHKSSAGLDLPSITSFPWKDKDI